MSLLQVQTNVANILHKQSIQSPFGSFIYRAFGAFGLRRVVPPSRRRAQCGYKACKFQDEVRNYKRHQVSVQAGGPVILANAGFGVGGRWHSWMRPTTGEL